MHDGFGVVKSWYPFSDSRMHVQDLAAAVEQYERSAAQGVREGQYHLAICLLHGRGTAQVILALAGQLTKLLVGGTSTAFVVIGIWATAI